MSDTVRDLFLTGGLVAVLHFRVFSFHLYRTRGVIRDERRCLSLSGQRTCELILTTATAACRMFSFARMLRPHHSHIDLIGLRLNTLRIVVGLRLDVRSASCPVVFLTSIVRERGRLLLVQTNIPHVRCMRWHGRHIENIERLPIELNQA